MDDDKAFWPDGAPDYRFYDDDAGVWISNPYQDVVRWEGVCNTKNSDAKKQLCSRAHSSHEEMYRDDWLSMGVSSPPQWVKGYVAPGGAPITAPADVRRVCLHAARLLSPALPLPPPAFTSLHRSSPKPLPPSLPPSPSLRTTYAGRVLLRARKNRARPTRRNHRGARRGLLDRRDARGAPVQRDVERRQPRDA